MAVSLVSTGVQYPDSTIQTTAATSSVFTDGSIVIVGNEGVAGGGGGVYVLQNPTSNNTNLIYTGSPAEDLNITTGISQNRGFTKYKPRDVKRDLFHGGLLAQAKIEYDIGGSNTTKFSLCYSKSGRSDWTSEASVANQQMQGAVNPYTGRNVWIRVGQQNILGYSNPSATAWRREGATEINCNTIVGEDVTPQLLNFLDLGTEGASKFFIGARAVFSNAYYVLYSSNGTSWTAVNADNSSRTWNAGNFVGNSTEIIAGHSSGSSTGLLRSTDSGSSWSQYAFGDTGSNTNNSYYPKTMAHNGTYWCAVNSNNNRMVSKAMGSGTSWTQTDFHNQVSGTYGNAASIAWNSVDSKWYALTDNYDSLWTNSSSNPGSGTWVLANHFGQKFGEKTFGHIMALSSQSLNPYMWIG